MTDIETRIIAVKKEIRDCASEKRRRDLEKYLRRLIQSASAERNKRKG